MTVDWILSEFGEKRASAIRQYDDFVLDGMQGKSPWDDLRGQVILGQDDFVEGIKEIIGDKEKIAEIPRIQRYIARMSLKEIFSKRPLRGRKQKDKAIYNAYVQYGYTLKDIAIFLGVHYATISRAIKRIENGEDSGK